MKVILFTLSYLFPLFIIAQGNNTPCETFERIKKEAKGFESKGKFEQALDKYYSAQVSARDCGNKKEIEIKGLIVGLFEKINTLKDKATAKEQEALKAKKVAVESAFFIDYQKNLLKAKLVELTFSEIATNKEKQRAEFSEKKAIESKLLAESKAKQAEMASNNATALYWSSEAGKINPIQGLKLSEKALEKTSDSTIQNIIKEQTEQIFNSSNTHLFKEMSRFAGIRGLHDYPDRNKKFLHFSSDGKWLLTQTEKYDVILRDVTTGKSSNILNNEHDIREADFSPDGKWITTINSQKKANLWNIETGQMYLLTKGDREIQDLKFSSDNKWLVTIFTDLDNEVWEIPTMQVHNTLKNIKDMAYVTFFPNSKWIIAHDSSYNKIVRIDDSNTHSQVISIETGEAVEFLKDEQKLSLFTFSDSGNFLVATNNQFQYKIWDLNLKKKLDFLDGLNDFHSLRFSKNSKYLVSESNDEGSKIWEIATGKRIGSIKDEEYIFSPSISPDSKFIILGNAKEQVKVYNLETGKIQFPMKEDIRFLSFSPDSKWLITLDIHSESKVYDIQTGKTLNFLENEKGVFSIIFSPNSERLITQFQNGNVKLWEVESGRLLKTFNDNQRLNYLFLPNNLTLASYSNDNGKMKIWSFSNLEIPVLIDDKNIIRYSFFSADNKWFCTSNNEGIMSIRETKGNVKHDFLKNENRIIELSFSPDSKWFFTQNEFRDCKIWELKTGKIPLFLKEEKIKEVFFSNNGKWLITKGSDNYYKIWDLKTGQSVNFWEKDDKVQQMVISPNSRFLIIKYADFKSKSELWDLEREIGIKRDFLKAEKDIQKFVFSKDSKWLTTTTANLEHKIWNLESGKNHPLLIKNGSLPERFSSEGKYITTRNATLKQEVYETATGKLLDFLHSETDIWNVSFSPDDQWMETNNGNGDGKFWDLEKRKQLDFFPKDLPMIRDVIFSPDSRMAVVMGLKSRNDAVSVAKVLAIPSGLELDFLKGINLQYAAFSNDNKWLMVKSNHKVITYEITTGKSIQTLWVNKKPTQIQIIDNRYLYVTVGKAIIKMDIQEQRGDFFSYGDGEPLDYTYEEIEEWKKVFGEKYLLPLDDEIKKKYGLVDDQSELKTSKK